MPNMNSNLLSNHAYESEGMNAITTESEKKKESTLRVTIYEFYKILAKID
jgi:hypothetical protein